MGKQVLDTLKQVDWRKWVAALVLAASLTGIQLLAANAPDPVGSFFVQPVYTGCQQGGSCG